MAVDEIEGMLSRAEAYFGRRVTAVFVAIVGLGAVSAAIRAVFSNIVSPVLTIITGSGLSIIAMLNAGNALILVGLAIMLFSEYRRGRKEGLRLAETEELLKRTERAYLEVQENQDLALAGYKEAQEKIAISGLMLESIAKILRSQGAIGQDQADAILSLLSIGPETPP